MIQVVIIAVILLLSWVSSFSTLTEGHHIISSDSKSVKRKFKDGSGSCLPGTHLAFRSPRHCMDSPPISRERFASPGSLVIAVTST